MWRRTRKTGLDTGQLGARLGHGEIQRDNQALEFESLVGGRLPGGQRALRKSTAIVLRRGSGHAHPAFHRHAVAIARGLGRDRHAVARRTKHRRNDREKSGKQRHNAEDPLRRAMDFEFAANTHGLESDFNFNKGRNQRK